MSDIGILATGLTKSFSGRAVLHGVSFAVGKGEVVGLLGPNGAGKTTTIRILLGLLRADAGSVRIQGLDPFSYRERVLSQVGYLGENAPLYPEMRTEAFLGFIASARAVPRAKDALRDVIEMTGLSRVRGSVIGTLSKGYRRRVALAQALIHNPPVLILDEPTDGLDPVQKRHTRELIRDLSTHKAILLSTHILEEVESLASRVVVIDDGKIIADEATDELLASHRGEKTLTIFTDALFAERVQSIRALKGVTAVMTNASMQEIIVNLSAMDTVREIMSLLKDWSASVHDLRVNQVGLQEVFYQLLDTKE